jgi:hypothetical protein
MEHLKAEDIELLEQKKYPGFPYALLINTIGIVFTILLWLLFFGMERKGWEIPLISLYKLHIVFPISLWGIFYGVSALLNHKINLDLRYQEKIIEIKKLKEIKYNRRFPYTTEMNNSNSYGSGHLSEYIMIFEDDTLFKSNSIPENVVVGKNYKISRAKQSKIVLQIESIVA